MAADPDRYEAWYTQKIWNLLPAIYRAEDSETFDESGPLEELVARIGVEAAVVRRSIDRLWDDQLIETCDDWVIDYIGDLLGTNLVPGLDGRERRVDVGKTIYYRRRKGTVALLEELAADVTGWTARVVEFFRCMGRTRHGLDVPIGLPAPASDPRGALQRAQRLVGLHTRTSAGGLADLRDVHGANLTGTAFDEYFHTGDVRRGRGASGWHDIPRLGVFVWRLHSLAVTGATAVRDTSCPNQYTFDPTGRDVPLFAPQPPPSWHDWQSAREHEVPGRISADLLHAAFDDLYVPGSIYVNRYVGPQADAYVEVPATEVTRDRRTTTGRFAIDPERGRLVAPIGAHGETFLVDYHYGFTSEIGAGTYDRRIPGITADNAPQPRVSPVEHGDPELATALTALSHIGTVRTGTVTIADSRTYRTIADVSDISDVCVRADELQRPLVRPEVSEWVFTGNPGAVLTFDGLFLSGADLVLRGAFDRVTVRYCTLDPGRWNDDDSNPDFAPAADGELLRAAVLRVEGTVRELVIERSIVGPIEQGANALVERLFVQDTVVQAVEPDVPAIRLTTGEAALVRCSVLGPAGFLRLDASECILYGDVQVEDVQQGCLRFSAWTTGSTLPRQYECVELAARTPLFVSRDFGSPDYAQVVDTAGAAILEGAENGSELGAFARERRSLRERSLLIKYREYLPLGLEPVLLHVT
jgi:hypothetical protein